MLIPVPSWAYLPLIFAVTALYDLGLQRLKYFSVLEDYFSTYKGLTAMALAGACGLLAASLAQISLTPELSLLYLGCIAAISAGVGLGMKYLKYAPPLNTSYYKQPLSTTVPLDAASGLIVASTTLALFKPAPPA